MTPNLALYGTEEAPEPPRLLRAGPLTAELDAGNLRHIRVGGLEVIRAVSFIVRDRNWGTYNPEIRDLAVEETADGFTVAYTAEAGDEGQRFRYRARIAGRPDGVVFEGEGEGLTDFETNRTGFVVLHPIEGVAGEGVTIERVDGSVEEARFPALIDPLQPMMDLRALTHRPAPGLSVECRMEGDTFEMEDQRNWTDASYKTYVRPLARPWPYRLPAGETIRQTVTVRITGSVPATSAAGVARLTVGEPRGTVPPIGTGLSSAEHAATAEFVERVADAGLAHLVCHYDPRRGDGIATLREAARLAAALGSEPWLEAVIADVDGFADEVAALGRDAAELGSPFRTVLVSPAADLKGTLPGSPWPPAPPLADLYRAARAAFPGARIGGGTFAFFTELNRKRPPLEALDLVTFTTSALVHAGDDTTVMENLFALDAVAASARAIAGDRPVHVGPSAIGMRLNPYGAAPMANPHNIRQAMNESDPRQRGLFGAAWAVGHAARLAAGGVAAVSFGGTTGPHGIVAPAGDAAGTCLPMFHAVRALARLSGLPLRPVSAGSAVQGLAAGAPAEAVIANLAAEQQVVEVPFEASVALLSADDVPAAATDAAFLDRLAPLSGRLVLGPYAVARLVAR